MKRKFGENKNMTVQKRNADGLFEAAQSRKPDYSRARARPEVGVSIQVGITTGQDGAVGPAGATDAADAEAIAKAMAEDDDAFDGGIMIEAPFDDDIFGDY